MCYRLWNSSEFEDSTQNAKIYANTGATVYDNCYSTSIIDLTLNVTREDSGSYTSNYFCNSFSPDKQWLSISTYGSGASTQYINWQKEHKAYEEYQNALNAFDKASQIYYKVLSSVLGGNTTENLVNYMESLKNGTEGQQSYYKDLVEDYGYILALYEPIKTEVADLGMKPEESASMVMGSRNLRLIPTVYLEAGNDADGNNRRFTHRRSSSNYR